MDPSKQPLFDPNQVQYIDLSSEEEDDYSSEMVGGDQSNSMMQKEEAKGGLNSM